MSNRAPNRKIVYDFYGFSYFYDLRFFWKPVKIVKTVKTSWPLFSTFCNNNDQFKEVACCYPAVLGKPCIPQLLLQKHVLDVEWKKVYHRSNVKRHLEGLKPMIYGAFLCFSLFTVFTVFTSKNHFIFTIY